MKKNPSRSSKKPRRSKSSQQRLQRKQRRNQSSSEFDYQNLEPRYALDASFAYDDANGILDLSDFTNDVTITHNGSTFTAVLSGGGVWTGDDPTDDVNDIAAVGDTLTLGSNFLSSVTADLNGNNLTFGASNFANGQSFTIVDSGDVTQTASVDIDVLSVTGFGNVDLQDPGNILGTLDVDVFGQASVFSITSITGTTFEGDDGVTIESVSIVNFDEIFSFGGIRVTAGLTANLGDIGSGVTDYIDVDASAINATSVLTLSLIHI